MSEKLHSKSKLIASLAIIAGLCTGKALNDLSNKHQNSPNFAMQSPKQPDHILSIGEKISDITEINPKLGDVQQWHLITHNPTANEDLAVIYSPLQSEVLLHNDPLIAKGYVVTRVSDGRILLTEVTFNKYDNDILAFENSSYIDDSSFIFIYRNPKPSDPRHEVMTVSIIPTSSGATISESNSPQFAAAHQFPTAII